MILSTIPLSSAPAAAARDLERHVDRLRTSEPQCESRQRTTILTELELISIELERVILRNENRDDRAGMNPDHARRVEQCAARLQSLLKYWPNQVFVSPLERLAA